MSDIANEKIKAGHSTGFLPEIWPADHVAGAQGIEHEVVLASGDWRQYRSSAQPQWGPNGGDKQHCVSRSHINAVEAQLNFRYQNNLLPAETVAFFKNNGYIVDGKIELNVRYLAQVSGTTWQGNSVSAVANAGRKRGYAPRECPSYPDNIDLEWDAYYVTPSAEAERLAQESLKHIQLDYVWLVTGALSDSEQIKKLMLFHMKHAPLQVASDLCPPWNQSDVPLCGLTQSRHAYLIDWMEDQKTLWAFDHYDPYTKRLPWHYIIPYAIKLVVTPCFKGTQVAEFHPPNGVGSVLKVQGLDKPGLYMYGLDKQWHGIGDMAVLEVYKGKYDPTKTYRVLTLPSNVSFTIGKLDVPSKAIDQPSLLEAILHLFTKQSGMSLVSKFPLLGSSVDPEKLSLTLKGLVPLVLAIAAAFSINIDGTEIDGYIDALVAIVSGATVLWGLVRKIKVWFDNRQQ